MRMFAYILRGFVAVFFLFCSRPVSANSLKTGNSAPAIRDIIINAPMEFDSKTKAEIYALRRLYVLKNQDLIQGEYQPSEAVFGQIEDRKPWWGITGQFCGGNGRSTIDGPSEEARFILNPFILLAVEEDKAWSIDSTCTPAYPRPVSFQWSARDSKAKVTYEISDFIRQRKKDGFSSDAAENAVFELKNINARDFGYEYVSVESYYSGNIRKFGSARMFEDSIPLQSFIHCGGSCRQPGGCNNGSPDEPDLKFTVIKLPATMYCRLWKKKPAIIQLQEDFTFSIDFK